MRIKDLSLTIDGTSLLDTVSFEVPEGSIFTLLGPNGAGKTLLLRCLAGLLRPTSGEVTTTLKPTQIAWVPLSQLWPFEFRVHDLVVMGRYSHHQGYVQTRDREAATRALERLGIETLYDRSYNSLSRGEQTKVDIARAIASDAELILLDEPFSNLDIDASLQLIKLFKELCSEGKTLILSHHDLFSVNQLATHALLLRKGQVLQHGSLKEVFQEKAIEKTYNVRAVFYTDGVSQGEFIRFESL